MFGVTVLPGLEPKAHLRDQAGKVNSSVLLVVRKRKKAVPDRQVRDQAEGQRSTTQPVVHAGINQAGRDDGCNAKLKEGSWICMDWHN